MPRIRSLDLARGFSVAFIPMVHTVMLYSKLSVHTSWLGYPLRFIAEGPGGQLFMVIMGIVFTFRKVHVFSDVLKKSLGLLAAGFGLNGLKFVLPYAAGILPAGVQHLLQLETGPVRWWQLFSMGDILHFAAIALIVLHIVYRLAQYQWVALVAAVVTIFVSPLIWDSGSTNAVFHYILQLFTGQPPGAFFPVFPWIVYPLIGLFIGYYLKRHLDQAMIGCGIAGLICLIFGGTQMLVLQEYTDAGFYRTLPGATIAHLGVVGLALFAWHLVERHITSPNRFFRWLEYNSTHITTIYLVQWVLIGWLWPLIDYQSLDVWPSFGVGLCTTGMTYGITAAIHLFREYGTHHKF